MSDLTAAAAADSNAATSKGDSPTEADQNPALPDGGPGDASHEGDSWETAGSHDASSSEEKAHQPEGGVLDDGSLSPGSTATDSSTVLD